MANDRANNTTNGQNQKDEEESKDGGQEGEGKDNSENKDKQNADLTNKKDNEEDDEHLAEVKAKIKRKIISTAIIVFLAMIPIFVLVAIFSPLELLGSKIIEEKYDIEKNVYIRIGDKEYYNDYHLEDFLVCSASAYFPQFKNYEISNLDISPEDSEDEINRKTNDYNDLMNNLSNNLSLLSSYYIYARSVLLKSGEYEYNPNENEKYKVILDFDKVGEGFPNLPNNSCARLNKRGLDNYGYGVDDFESFYYRENKSFYILAYEETKNMILLPSTFNKEHNVFTHYAAYLDIGENENLILNANDYNKTWENIINRNDDNYNISYNNILNKTHFVDEKKRDFYYFIYDFSDTEGKEPTDASKLTDLKISAYYPIGSASCNGKICSGDPTISSPGDYGFSEDGSFSDGIDIGITVGPANIVAIQSGTVTGVRSSLGSVTPTSVEIRPIFSIGTANNIVEITHGSGMISFYGNLDTIDVTLGETVQIGQKIGTVKQGSKLYFAVRYGPTGSLINPYSVVSITNPRPIVAQSITFVQGVDNKQTVCLTLRASGFDDNAVAGIMANMQYESGFDPTECGDHNTSYGLAQWHNSFFNELIAFSGENADFRSFNNDYCGTSHHIFSDIKVQLDFLVTNLPKRKPNVHKELLTNDSAEEKGYYWCYYYEVPASRETSCREKRGPAAKTIYLPYVRNGCN